MKATLLKIAAAAAGITLALCVAAAAFFWYASRPQPPKPWNTNALRVATVKANPISTLNDKFQETGSGIFFTVDIENATPNDLTLQNLTIMQEAKSSHALHGSFLKLNRDYFLPAHRNHLTSHR